MTIARKITFCPHLHKLVIDGTKTVTRRLKTSVREGEIIAAVTESAHPQPTTQPAKGTK